MSTCRYGLEYMHLDGESCGYCQRDAARAEAGALREALEESILPLMALWLSHGDQFSPEMLAQVRRADALARAALDAAKR